MIEAWLSLLTYQESHTRTITLQEDDPFMVMSMISFIYTSDYSDCNLAKVPLIFNAGMYALGDKYVIPLLKVLAEMKFSVALKSFNPSRAGIFVKAIHTIYTTTLSSDRELRRCLTPVLAKHKFALRNNGEFMGLVKSGLADGDFAGDVIDAWIGTDPLSNPAERKWYCRICPRQGVRSEKDCHVCGQRVLESPR